MKVKFTKLAALLLAGAALLAAGCTDYEVDIQNVDKKVDALAAKTVADLEAQADALRAMINTLDNDLTNDISKIEDDVEALQGALDDLNSDFNKAIERIKALEDADENFQKAVEELGKKYDKLAEEKADKTALDAVKNELEALINSEIAKLDDRMKDAEAAIKEMKETTIPAINKQIEDLQNLKLDASTFEAYKEATATTISLMQDAIDELAAADEDFQEKIDEIIAKFDDYVLTSTFEEFVKIAATKEELEDMENTLKTYVDGKVKDVKDELDKVKEDMGKLDERVVNLENTVSDIVDELAFAEGDLQGYIDDAAANALESAIAYVDEQIAAIKDSLMYYITDIYNLLFANLQRIQSVVFVPTHDDLKMNMNVSIITQDAVNEETGETEKVAFYYGQPTEVTYKITPTEYAEWLAYYVNNYALDKAMSQLYKEYLDYSIPAVFFDVKPLQTRADEEEEETPELAILGVVNSDNETGEITFLVEPYGIASPEFIANANKPSYEFALGMMDDEDNFTPLTAYNIDTDESGDVVGENFLGVLYYLFGLEGYTIPVWKFEDHMMYELRKPFAASLTVYCPDADNFGLYMDGWTEGSSGDLEMDEYFIMSNEVSSTYSVLYPVVMTMDILPDPYKPELDENGEPVLDEDGYHVMVEALPDYQRLPYSSLRENPIGEDPAQEPKGYRVVLDQAVPAISVNGGEPMMLEEASDKYNLYYPSFYIEPVEFSYDKGTAESVDEENFIVSQPEGYLYEDVQFEEDGPTFDLYEIPLDKYAEVEMNPDKSAAERREAVGNIITGTYTFTSFLGSFSADGQVEITKPLGSVDLDAKIVWTWALDADVDHANFYEDAEMPYSRKAYEVNIDEEDAKSLEDNLAVTIQDFSKLEPTSLKVTYVDAETGEEVDATQDLVIENVTITEDGKLLADFSNFLWDTVYTIVAEYELESALITVNGTLTTVDRNREKVVIGPIEHTFIINGEEYYDGYYHWTSDPLYGPIFKAFDEESVINVEDNVDFEYDAAQDEFNASELEGKLKAAADAGTAKGYVDIKNAEDTDVYAWTMKSFTSSVLAGEIFNSGERSADDPNLWLGNTVTRNITTYIGEEVEFQFIFNYKVPDYNFLHLRFYTFNKDKEVDGLIQQLDFADNDGSVLWWSQVYPSYFTTVKEEGTNETDAQNRVSNRYALADYDVAYINLAELAFNVVDENDDIIEDAQLEELGLNVKFVYTDETQGEKELPEVDKIDPEFLLYESLWVDNTIFYYRTNEKKFIPALGQLTLTSGDYDFPVATRFEFPKNSVKFPEEVLDYSTYAMVRWTPFKEPVANGFTIVLDENKIYREPLFKGMFLQDNRPTGVSFYVIKDGEWVVGDAAENATAASKSNGYISGIAANDAYHITTDFVYDTTGIPNELKKLLSVEVENGVPYVVYNYTSEVQFHGVITLPVVVKLENPWQEQLKFVYNVTIKGVGD
ncbi:MAG: hypothetical protein IJP49_05840 [Bacteroidales bacterium]|nr:hypothetical protein [Bacteroidales bacterium]